LSARLSIFSRRLRRKEMKRGELPTSSQPGLCSPGLPHCLISPANSSTHRGHCYGFALRPRVL
jgi:hypothetical protein